MVKLRLRRLGKKDFPIYKIVAADSSSPRDGRYIESVGLYDPKTHPITIDVKEEKVIYWLKRGAQPTPTVRSLFSRKGILLKWHLVKKGKDETEILKKMDVWHEVQTGKAYKELEKKRKIKAKRRKNETAEKPAEEKQQTETTAS